MDQHERVTVWDEWHSGSAPRYPHDKVIQFVYRGFGRDPLDSSSATALDLGCGSGIHTAFLAECGFSVTGVDASPKALANTAALLDKAGLGADLMQAFLGDVRFESGSFDCIISTGVLDYCGSSDAATVAPQIPRWLKPGGIALLVFAAEGDFRQGTVENLDLHCWTRDEVRAAFASTSEVEVCIDQYVTTFRNDTFRQVDWLVTMKSAERG